MEEEQAQAEFQPVEEEQEQAQAEFQPMEAELEQAQAEFQPVEAELEQAQAEFQPVEAELKQAQAEGQQLEMELSRKQALPAALEELERYRKAEEDMDMSTIGILQDKFEHMEEIQIQLREVLGELYDASRLEQGDILVIGCSTSEVAGGRIGTYSSQEIGECLFQTASLFCRERGIYLACQCCEHLNRSLIVEKACMKEHRLTRVNVVPQLKAGGAFATAAYRHMQEPVAVEEIVAQAGVDIGDTLIGMHLASVAVPVRTGQRVIGQAHVACARTRAKYVGGSRAVYDDCI